MHPLFLSVIVLLVIVATSTSTLMMSASVSPIQQEGNAMADIARAIPKLTTLSGKDREILCALCIRVSCESIPFLR